MAEKKSTASVTPTLDTSGITGKTIIVEQDVMIPLRDGTKISCDIYRANDNEKRPVVIEKSPYEKKQFWPIHSQLCSPYVMAQKGYVAVIVEDRGRNMSEGTWHPFIDDAQDTYDAVEWAAVQPWSNGKVGLYGNCGYGYETYQGAAANPPHLKAIFAHTTSPNPYGSWTYHNGVYHLAFMSAWTAVQSMDTAIHDFGMSPEEMGAKYYPEFYRYYLSGRTRPPKPQDAWEAAPRDLPVADIPGLSDMPYWKEWHKHPGYDDYWKQANTIEKAKEGKINVPVLQLIGWYDNSCQDNVEMFKALQENSDPSVRNKHRFVVGPWDHSAYYNNRASYSGERDFGFENETGTSLSIPMFFSWFNYWLKDEGDGFMPGENAIRYFHMGENVWKEAPSWPPAHQEVKYYLHSAGRANSSMGNGTLSEKAPSVEPLDTYVYDPLDPVLSVGGRSMLMATGVWDQAEIEKRNDVLVYTTPALAEKVAIAGSIKLELYASSNCPDTDFAVKLVDVEPDGYCANITEGIIRARYRNGCDHEVFLNPGEVTKFEISIDDVAHTFMPGHRIRLAIASSDFPNFDRNLNSKISPALGTEKDARKAVQQIFHEGKYPSNIVLPVTLSSKNIGV